MANVRSLPPPTMPPTMWQPSLLDANAHESSFDATFARARRIELGAGAWVDHVDGWVRGADELFEQLVAGAPWEQRRVHMYDRMVDEPRLTAWYGAGLLGPDLPAVIATMAPALSARYDRTFDSVGAALYRDGRDSVAWHGDRIPLELVDPVVALVSLGSPRVLRMRCAAHKADARAFRLLPGDLFVMGGTSQRTWQHSVPKVAHAGPRLSLQFRHSQ